MVGRQALSSAFARWDLRSGLWCTRVCSRPCDLCRILRAWGN